MTEGDPGSRKKALDQSVFLDLFGASLWRCFEWLADVETPRVLFDTPDVFFTAYRRTRAHRPIKILCGVLGISYKVVIYGVQALLEKYFVFASIDDRCAGYLSWS